MNQSLTPAIFSICILDSQGTFACPIKHFSPFPTIPASHAKTEIRHRFHKKCRTASTNKTQCKRKLSFLQRKSRKCCWQTFIEENWSKQTNIQKP